MCGSYKMGTLVVNRLKYMWDKVFKNGPSKICGRQPLKNLKEYGRPYSFKFFKGSLPQILLGPFLNTLTHVMLCSIWRAICTI